MGIMNDFVKEFLKTKLVLIARRIPLEKIGKCAVAAMDGGALYLESTFDQSDPDCIINNQRAIEEIIRATDGKMCVGAGTVLTREQVRAAHSAGAKYIISPNTNADVMDETKKLGMASIPGAMTPTEIENAYLLGADLVKLFPADDLGYHYIQNIISPLSHIPLMATGGINPKSIPEFYKCGIMAFGTGISVFKRELIANEDYSGITVLAREHFDVLKSLGE